MKKKKGDLIELALNGNFDVIVHGCNCFCTMGAGIAKQIKATFPEAYKADLQTEKGLKEKLGTISFTEVETEKGQLVIVNAYTQFHWKGVGKKVSYEAVKNCFKHIKSNFSGKRIGYPAIGAGLAGGDWNIISEIIEKELTDENHTFVEFQKK